MSEEKYIWLNINEWMNAWMRMYVICMKGETEAQSNSQQLEGRKTHLNIYRISKY